MSLEQSYVVQMKYLIILGYLHSPWNLVRYCVTLRKPKRNTILAPYSNNTLNHDINEGIVKLVTLMVKGNEFLTKTRVLQLHSKTLLKTHLIPSMWQILQYLHIHRPTILHWSIKRFLPFMSLKLSFNYI
jgi:hypothetical protein